MCADSSSSVPKTSKISLDFETRVPSKSPVVPLSPVLVYIFIFSFKNENLKIHFLKKMLYVKLLFTIEDECASVWVEYRSFIEFEQSQSNLFDDVLTKILREGEDDKLKIFVSRIEDPESEIDVEKTTGEYSPEMGNYVIM